MTLAAPPLDPWLQFLDARGIISNFASAYLASHGRVSPAFQPDDQTLQDFRDFLTRGNVRSPVEFWRQDQDYLKSRIQQEVLNLTFGLNAGNEAAVKGDPQIQKAVALFPEIPKVLGPPVAATSAHR